MRIVILMDNINYGALNDKVKIILLFDIEDDLINAVGNEMLTTGAIDDPSLVEGLLVAEIL